MGTIFGMMICFGFNMDQGQVEYYWLGAKYFVQLANYPRYTEKQKRAKTAFLVEPFFVRNSALLETLF